MCELVSNRAFTFKMARSVVCGRSLRSKLLYNGGSRNAVRSLLLTRSCNHNVAEARTATTSERDQIAASSEQTLRGFHFNDGKNAFRSKTTWEIVRALTIFRLCSFDFLVNRNKEVGKRFLEFIRLGQFIVRLAIAPNFYAEERLRSFRRTYVTYKLISTTYRDIDNSNLRKTSLWFGTHFQKMKDYKIVA